MFRRLAISIEFDQYKVYRTINNTYTVTDKHGRSITTVYYTDMLWTECENSTKPGAMIVRVSKDDHEGKPYEYAFVIVLISTPGKAYKWRATQIDVDHFWDHESGVCISRDQALNTAISWVASLFD